MKRYLKKLRDRFWKPSEYPRKSFSQCGEDLIIRFVGNELRMGRISYLDIGAYHPVELSNTYLFYLRGSRGVCVEPNPLLFQRFRRKRPGDVCLNVGVSDEKQKDAPFYVLTSDTLCTFSSEEAERYSTNPGEKIERIVSIPIIGINDLLDSLPSCPNLLSLDTEGLDLKILQRFDFSRYRPQVLCIETLSFTTDHSGVKNAATMAHLESCGYFVYADTYINTIFVDREVWRRR